MNQFYSNSRAKFVRVTKDTPCPHCGKPDFCYSLGELSVCGRDNEPASGWKKTSKQDDNGNYFYAPESVKVVNPKGKTEYHYPDREGNPLIKVVRIDDGLGKKKVYQNYWDGKRWQKTLENCDESKVPIYRYQEIREAIANNAIYIFIVEGEKCADKLWKLGLPATTTKQGLLHWLPEHSEDLEGARTIVLCPDRDRPGLKKMLKIGECLRLIDCQIAWLLAPPSDFFWKNLPDSKGADVADWINDGLTSIDVVNQIKYDFPLQLEVKTEDKPAIEETEDNFTQKAYNALYSGSKYISIASELYSWNGNFYERVAESTEKKRIALWCQSTPIAKRGGGYRYGLANTSKVEEIYKWAVLLNAVDPSEVNPPGINCKNGVVEIVWDGKQPSFRLQPPSSDRFFTYCSDIEYNPQADPTMCDRLLAALEAPQREIFLKTIAASFDLEKVRKYNSGNIKALLLQGTGSNGKDSLWQAVASIVGETMTHISFSDFQEYDKGRKFNVARLEASRICWASENSEYISLDNVQVLKQAITGEKIAIEQKNAPAYLMDVNSVFLFNVNQAPLITAGLEAISRRYAVLDFNKTYCKEANPALGQLEADPRFRYDVEFLNTEVAPALLNYLLSAFEALIKEGINYSSCDSSLERIKKSSNHLWEFADDIGLIPDPSDQVYVQEIWEQLREWYSDQDILTIENGNNYWQPPIRKGDEYVKASRLLYSRLKDIFPHVTKGNSTTGNIKNKAIIYGIVQSDAVRQTVRLEVNQNMAVRQSEAKQLNSVEFEYFKRQVSKLTSFQALEVQKYLQSQLINNSSTENDENGKISPDSNIVDLPNFASPPSLSGLQPNHLPNYLPNFASPEDITDLTQKDDCITSFEAFKHKIEFVWDDSKTCFEVLVMTYPYINYRQPGTRETKSKKLDEFCKVQIGNKVYRLV